MSSAVEQEVAPVKVLIIGGSYGGLGAALNLLDFSKGKYSRFAGKVGNDPKAGPRSRFPVQIKIVDERDGYCG
jgi:hypothetical protein